jgi:hypothetical protein
VGSAAKRKAQARKVTWVAPETPVSVRFEREMIQRLDRVARQLSSINSNIRVGRSSVVKLALERALSGIEAELSIGKGENERAI